MLEDEAMLKARWVIGAAVPKANRRAIFTLAFKFTVGLRYMFRDSNSVAYALMRLSLGVNIFGHGFFRILGGVSAFANGTVKGLDKGPLPHALSLGFLYATPFIELTLGLLLIVGLFTRLALAMGALFMVALTVGVTSIQNWATAGTQLEYSAVFFFMLWLVKANAISLDSLLPRRKRDAPVRTV